MSENSDCLRLRCSRAESVSKAASSKRITILG